MIDFTTMMSALNRHVSSLYRSMRPWSRLVALLVWTMTALLTSLAGTSHAKGGDVMLQKTDVLAHRQQAVASAVDSAGNLVVTGFRNLTNDSNDDFWTVKFAPDGTVAWQKPYNRNGGSDQATAVVIDKNNNVIVTGYAWNGSNNDVYTVKYQGTNGAVLWEHIYSGLPSGNEVGSAIAYEPVSDLVYVGGYIQNSGGNEDYLVLKYDNSRTGTNPPLDAFSIGATAGGNDRITAIAAGTNGIAVTGTSWNGTDFDVLTILLETTGAIRWQQRYSSTGSYPENGRYIRFDASGNVVVAATVSNPMDFDIYLAKYNGTSGTPIWQRTYNGAFDDEPMGMVVAGDGDVYLTGYTWTLAGNNDFYTARFSGITGNPVWQQIYNSGYDNSDIATATGIVVDDGPQGDVFVTGYTVASENYDYRTLKYKKENGHLIWQRGYNGPANRGDRTVGIALAPNNGLYVAGWSDMTVPIPGETSAATGGTTASLQNSGKSWSANQWADFYVMMTGGSNAGIVRKISGNTATSLTVTPDFGAAVAAGDAYYIFDKDDYDLHVIVYDRGDLNPPTGLASSTVAKAGNGTYTIRLTWEDNSSDESGFIIERKLGELGTYTEIARVGANVTTYDDPGLAANEYFYYQVKSYRNTSESHPSPDTHSLTFLVTYLDPLWQRPYNGGENMEDYVTSIAVGPDDNPVLTGRSDSGLDGMFDFYTMKLNRANGNVIWEDRYDSMQNEMDMAVCLAVDNNNDAVVSGFSSLYYAPIEGNAHSLFTMKYPAAGPPVTWEKQYNGPAGIDDRSTAIASALDGSTIFIVGYGLNARYDNDIYLVKYLGDGTEAWHITPIDGGRHDYPIGVVLDPQGNVVITGYRQGARGEVTDLDNFDFYTAKFNGTNGALIWEDTYNPYGTGDCRGQSLAVDASGNIYVTGYATNTSGNKDYYTIKYGSTTGNRIWERSHDGPAHGNDWAISVKVDPILGKNPLDSNVIVVGTQMTDSADNDSDIHLIRYSTDGEVRWQRTLLRPHVTDTAEAVAMDGSGYIYVAGDSGSDLDKDIIAVIYDYEGTLLGGTTYNGGYGYDQASSVVANHQGEAFIAGYTTNASQNADYIVIKQKNNYMLVPTPFVATPQADYTRIALTWRENTPGTRFRIEKTPGPATTESVWTLLTDVPSGTTTYTDTGLAANTQFCYRIEAYQGSLPSRKVIACGTTTLPTPIQNPASGVTTTGLTISWPSQTGNTGYKVERKIGAGSWEVAPNGILPTNSSSYTDSGLTAGTQHTYRVSARNAGGYSLPSTEKIVWTLPLATTLDPPVNVTATRIDLTWSNVVGETGFRVERKTGSAGAWQPIATKGADVLSHSDTTSTPNSDYYYQVIAFNSSGDGASSNQRNIISLGSPIAQANADNTVAGQLVLNWGDLGNETQYRVEESYCTYGVYDPTYYCLNNFYGTSYWSGWTQVGTTVANTTTITRSPLTNGYMYRYRIIAAIPGPGGVGTNTTEPSNLKGGWTRLDKPVLTVAPASVTSLALSWTNISSESKFEIWRKLGQAGTYAKVGEVGIDNLGFTDTNLAQQTEYCYKVIAVSTAGNTDAILPPPSESDEKCLPTPLPAPAFNTPLVVSATQIDISWNNVPGNAGYELERCRFYDPNTPQNGASYINYDASTGYWTECTPVITLNTDVTSYQDTGRTAGYTYRYRVRDKYGSTTTYYSAWSTPVVATTIPPAPVMTLPTAISDTQINPNWGDVAGEMEYRLYWKLREGSDCTAGAWNGPIVIGQNAGSYAHTGLQSGTYYCYQMTAANGTMVSPMSNVVSQTTTTVKPTIQSLQVLSTTSVKVTWSAITGATNYRISRRDFPGANYAVIATVAASPTEYTSSGLTAGSLYGYKVEAQNAGGFSPLSDEQTTTTKPAAPTVSGTGISNARIDLSWLEMKGATNYKVERRPSGGTWGEIINLSVPYVETYCGYPVPRIGCQSLSPNKTGHSDTSLTGGGTYCYQVKAWNTTGGDSAPSGEICLAISELAAPVVSASPLTSMKIGVTLAYTPGSCSSGPCESPTGYAVEKQAGSGEWQKAVILPAGTMDFIDETNIEPRKRYNYRALAFAGFMDTFDTGISAAKWSQQGILRNSANTIVVNDTTPPVLASDPANGTLSIAPTSSGGIQMATSSTGGGQVNSYNYTRMNLLSPSVVHGNFDVTIEYRLPEAPVTAAQYHVYGRLHVSLPTGAGTNYAYVERSANAYGAVITIDDFQYSGSIATTETSGKLRITRNGNRITAYAWTGGDWKALSTATGASAEAAIGVNFSQYVQRNEAVSLKILIDNIEALSNRSDYSQVKPVDTPVFATSHGSCQ